MVYYAFCGIDGAGKTTVINRMQDTGFDAVFTREPYHNQQMKETIIDDLPDPVETSYLFAMDRYLHMRDVIIPAKNAGKNIISDRCYICNLAYQSYGGVDLDWLMDLQPPNMVFPDAVIWFQCDPEIAAQRSGEGANRLSKIQQLYGEVLNSYELPAIPWYPVNVDGKNEDEVYTEVAMLIESLMRNKR